MRIKSRIVSHAHGRDLLGSIALVAVPPPEDGGGMAESLTGTREDQLPVGRAVLPHQGARLLWSLAGYTKHILLLCCTDVCIYHDVHTVG